MEHLHSPLPMHDGNGPFNAIFCWHFFQKSIRRHTSLSFMLFCFNFYIGSSCHTELKALDTTRNTALTPYYRSSPLEVFCRKGVLRNFAKVTGKHLCQSLFSRKIGLAKFLWILQNFLEHLFLQNSSGGCFCNSLIILM